MTPIGEHATRSVVAADETWTVSRAATEMRNRGFKHLPLVDEDWRPIGIVTDVRINGLVRRDLHDVSVLSATEPVGMVASVNADLRTQLGILVHSPADAALLVDDDDKLVGIFTEHDALVVAARWFEMGSTVGDLTRNDLPLHAVPLGTAASEARLAMLENGVRHLPVVDGQGRLAGMVSFRDLAGREATLIDTGLHSPVHQVGLDTDLKAAVGLMVEFHIGSLPVVGPDRTPLGVITRTDVLRELQRRLGVAAE